MNLLVLLVVSVPVVLALAVLASRVLGVRIGVVASLFAATTGWIGGVLLANAVDTTSDGWRVAIAVVTGLLATLAVAVVIELVVGPTDSPRRRISVSAALHPVDTARRQLDPLRRGRQVARIARSNGILRFRYAGASGIDDPAFGEGLRDTLQECGGILVKFGQIASTRTDALPPTVTGPLADLQSDVRPATADVVRPELEAGLGRPVEEVFAEFDWEPLAAASIGQTYRARLLDGRPVIVKCRRPGIEELVRRDGQALMTLASLLDTGRGGAGRFTILAGELVRNVEAEVDYRREAANAEAIAANRGGDGIDIPVIHRELCSAGVLVMDVADGVSVGTPGAVERCARPAPELANTLLASFLGQILQDGLYHADPHPGNVLVTPAGRLGLIDFGSVGHLDPRVLTGLQLLALGSTLRDPTIVVKGLVRVAPTPTSVDRSALEADVSRILGEELTGGGIDAAMLRQVFAVMDKHGIHVPQAFVVLSRSLFSLEGTLHLIDPNFDFGSAATSIVAGWYGGPEALDDEAMLKRELLRAVVLLRDLPTQVDQTAGALLAGQLKVQTSRYGGDDTAVVGAWFDRATIVVVAVGTLLSGSLLMLGAAIEDDTELQGLLTGLGLFSLLTGSVLAMRALARALSPRRR
ncbi:MAG: AarF/UbiB family protein [Acidimicrobiales bacterium]|nr:AarF/UbiB family protein [Acidimicrobiales bacterium]